MTFSHSTRSSGSFAEFVHPRSGARMNQTRLPRSAEIPLESTIHWSGAPECRMLAKVVEIKNTYDSWMPVRSTLAPYLGPASRAAMHFQSERHQLMSRKIMLHQQKNEKGKLIETSLGAGSHLLMRQG